MMNFRKDDSETLYQRHDDKGRGGSGWGGAKDQAPDKDGSTERMERLKREQEERDRARREENKKNK